MSLQADIGSLQSGVAAIRGFAIKSIDAGVFRFVTLPQVPYPWSYNYWRFHGYKGGVDTLVP